MFIPRSRLVMNVASIASVAAMESAFVMLLVRTVTHLGPFGPDRLAREAVSDFDPVIVEGCLLILIAALRSSLSRVVLIEAGRERRHLEEVFANATMATDLRKGQSMLAQDQDDLVIVPIDLARRRIIGGVSASDGSVGAILVKAEEGADHVAASVEIRPLLRQRLVADQEDDFQLRNLTEVMNAVASSANAISLLLAAVAAISLFVGGVRIMNMMLVSVTERVPEIGLRLAVGASRRNILIQFLTEAALLSIIGGLIGIALGWSLATVIATIAQWPTLIALHHMLGAIGFSALVGIVFGFVPALRASRLEPIAALRGLYQ